MLKIQQIFLKLYRCLLFFCHNLEPQTAGLVDVKKDLNKKRSKSIFVRENPKISIVIKNVIESEDTLMNKAERPINYFFQHFHTLSG